MERELTAREIETQDALESQTAEYLQGVFGIDFMDDDSPDRDKHFEMLHEIMSLVAEIGEMVLGIPECKTYPYVECPPEECNENLSQH